MHSVFVFSGCLLSHIALKTTGLIPFFFFFFFYCHSNDAAQSRAESPFSRPLFCRDDYAYPGHIMVSVTFLT